MDEMLKKYIDKLNASTMEQRRKERDELLTSLGLVYEAREYAPDDCSDEEAKAQGYDLEDDGYGYKRYNRVVMRPIEITDAEYEKLVDAINAKKRYEDADENTHEAERYEVVPNIKSKESRAGNFLFVIAWIIWIFGFIASLILSIDIDYGRYSSDTSFNFATFFICVVSFGLSGALVMCMSELFSNVQAIRNSLQGMTIRKK